MKVRILDRSKVVTLNKNYTLLKITALSSMMTKAMMVMINFVLGESIISSPDMLSIHLFGRDQANSVLTISSDTMLNPSILTFPPDQLLKRPYILSAPSISLDIPTLQAPLDSHRNLVILSK